MKGWHLMYVYNNDGLTRPNLVALDHLPTFQFLNLYQYTFALVYADHEIYLLYDQQVLS